MTDLLIERLGHRADGIARHGGADIYVPGALPGETVRAEIAGERATIIEILSPSPDRVAAPCPHYGSCGGCQLQHLGGAPYADFKRQLVIDALADRGLAAEVAPTVLVPPASRRRATFAGLMAGRHPLVGFNEKASHRIVEVDACAVLVPELVQARAALGRLVEAFDPRKAPLDLAVTATETGFDVSVRGLKGPLSEERRMRLIKVAGEIDLARLTVEGDVVVERRPPSVVIDAVRVILPPGGFLQASKAAEEAMSDLVADAVGKAKRVADLYAGVGTFALRLARRATVSAYEGDAAAVTALDRAARGMTGRSRIAPERRDLDRRPLVEKELDAFDAVVFDPPRAGAAAQSGWLARSKVATVVAISCNPATLARDLRLLVDGGYMIEAVTPIDQFLWSSHVEVVAVLRRKR